MQMKKVKNRLVYECNYVERAKILFILIVLFSNVYELIL